MIILFILEGLCVFPLMLIWTQADKGKIEEDTALNIGIGYTIVASIINWICYAANISGLKLFITQGLYESIIDSIMKFFYDNKKDLSVNNILIIQLPLDKYHQFINNTNSNLSKIESSLVNKINEYKSQGGKIDSALNILIDNINSLKN